MRSTCTARWAFRSDARPEDLFERPDDRCFNLIVVGQALPRPAADSAIDAFAVQLVIDDPGNDQALKHARITMPSYFVLRPDGYVALAGGRLMPAGIERYFVARDVRLQSRSERSATPPSPAGTADRARLKPASESSPGRQELIIDVVRARTIPRCIRDLQ